MADIKINISVISSAAKAAVKGLGDETKKTQTFFDKLRESVKNNNSVFKIFAGNLAAAGVAKLAVLIKDAAVSFVKLAADMETTSTQFKVLTGNAQLASLLIKDLYEFAAKTPFQFQDVSKAASTLLAFGFNIKQVKDALGPLGDVAAATNNDFADVARIFGQVNAAGKLTGERLVQLNERSIPILDALAKELDKPKSAIAELVSQGKVSFAVFERAFNSLSKEGGLAFGGMEQQSQTLNGRWSTLIDTTTQLAITIGEKFLPIAKSAVISITELVESFGKTTGLIKGQKTLSEVSAEIKTLEDRVVSLNKQKSDTWFLGAQRIGIQINTIQNKLKDLYSQRVELQKLADAEAASDKKIADDQAKTEAERAQTRAAYLAQKKQFDITSNEEEITRAVNLKEQLRLNDETAKIQQLEAEGKYTEALNIYSQLRITQAQNEAKKQEEIDKKKVEARDKTLQLFASLAQSENKTMAAIGKAAALTQIAIKTPEAVSNAYTFGTGIGGPVLGAAFGAIAASAMAAQAAKLTGLNFEKGGIVPGTSFTGDRVAANVNSGEMILNRQQQSRLFQLANAGGAGGQEIIVHTTVELDGEAIGKSVSRQVADGLKLGEVV